MNDWQLFSVAYFSIIMLSNTFILQNFDLHSSSYIENEQDEVW